MPAHPVNVDADKLAMQGYYPVSLVVYSFLEVLDISARALRRGTPQQGRAQVRMQSLPGPGPESAPAAAAAAPESAPAAAAAAPAPDPAARKRKNRWDQPKEELPGPASTSRWGAKVDPPAAMQAASLAALSAASSSKMQTVEAAASGVMQHGSQYEGVLQLQPQNAWLLQPSSPEYALYQQRLKVLRAQKQAALLTNATLPSQQAIAAIAKAAAASAGIAAAAAAAAASLLRPAHSALPAHAVLQTTGSGGMMATNSNGVGRVFYPPPRTAPKLPPKPEGGGYAAAPGGVGRVVRAVRQSNPRAPPQTSRGLSPGSGVNGSVN